MNILNDLIYFTYIGVDERELIRIMYRTDKRVFMSHLVQLFDIEFRNRILTEVGEPLIQNVSEEQKEIDLIFTEIAEYLHKNISEEGKAYWLSRGVTEEQIKEFKLGDNGVWMAKPEEMLPYFHLHLAKHYKVEYVQQAYHSMCDQLRTAERLYGSGLATCCPTYDTNGLCKGIVFRILNYKKNNNKMYKNMYKFYNPFSLSYLFPFSNVEKYDELIMVEGVFDALALMRAGYPNVISPSMVRLSPYHIETLRNKKLHILFDCDRGGLEGLKFIKDKFENETNLATLELCPTPKDFDEMTTTEIDTYMENVWHYDVRNLTSKPINKHSISKMEKK